VLTPENENTKEKKNTKKEEKNTLFCSGKLKVTYKFQKVKNTCWLVGFSKAA